MKLNKWLKRKAALIGLAMSNVEKNAFKQSGDNLGANIAQERRHTQGTLMDALLHGEITAEVKELRWRMYQTFKESKKFNVAFDKNGKPIPRTDLLNIKTDQFDEYPVELLVYNGEITKDVLNTLENDNIKLLDDAVKNYNEDGELISATHGKIDAIQYFTQNKGEKPILVYRKALVKFDIEKYTSKLIVRTISETEKLLEFYVNMYPDEDNRTSRLFISEVKKAIANPRASNMLEIDEVGFITDNSIGAPDFLEFQYKITSFDKIVEFNGNYVIKFKANAKVNGRSIIEEYRDIELDKKYEKKEKRKKK